MPRVIMWGLSLYCCVSHRCCTAEQRLMITLTITTSAAMSVLWAFVMAWDGTSCAGCQKPKVTSFDLSKTPAGDYQVPGLGAITGKSFIRLHDILKLIITKNFFYQNINKGSCTILLVGFPNWHVSGCQLGEETPLHSPIWLWRLLEPSNLVAPPKKYTFRIGTFIESIFAVDSSFTSAVVAEL